MHKRLLIQETWIYPISLACEGTVAPELFILHLLFNSSAISCFIHLHCQRRSGHRQHEEPPAATGNHRPIFGSKVATNHLKGPKTWPCKRASGVGFSTCTVTRNVWLRPACVDISDVSQVIYNQTKAIGNKNKEELVAKVVKSYQELLLGLSFFVVCQYAMSDVAGNSRQFFLGLNGSNDGPPKTNNVNTMRSIWNCGYQRPFFGDSGKTRVDSLQVSVKPWLPQSLAQVTGKKFASKILEVYIHIQHFFKTLW